MVTARFSGAFQQVVFLVATLVVVVTPEMRAEVESVKPNEAEAVDLRLRFTWGGGEPAVWMGRIWIESGSDNDDRRKGTNGPSKSIIDVDPVGQNIASCRTFHHRPTEVTIRSTSTCQNEAVDITIRAAVSANVKVVLDRIDALTSASKEPQPVTIPISKLVTGRHTSDLDSEGNRLTVQRVHGDRLRVDIQREHLVFSPREPWTIQVQPHVLGTSFPASATLHATIKRARSMDELWSEHQQFAIDGSGEIQGAATVAVPVPDREGVYDLELSVVRPRPRSLIPVVERVVDRVVQFVVVSDAAPDGVDRGWRKAPEWEFDPTEHRLFPLPRLVDVSARNALKPSLPRILNSRGAKTVERLDDFWTELPVEGWQAYLLPLTHVGEPHILEVEYPGDVRQNLGVSLVEPHAPNAGDGTSTAGVDGMIRVELPAEGRQRYRLIFWPKTKHPYVVFTNHHDSQPAVYGSFRVFRRDGRLPAVSVDDLLPPSSRRTAVARFSKPTFWQTFGATDRFDDESGHAYSDWVTFYEGAQRLIDYVRYLGYDAITITSMCDGSAIFPTDGVRSAAKYDTGRFFSNGQDPVCKDVLELLFRLCDRSGVRLIPVLELSSPIESLEQAEPADGIRFRESASQRPGYNPLDLRVRSAMVEFVDRVARRYGTHASFGGLGLTMNRRTATHMPNASSGGDPATVASFIREVGATGKWSVGSLADHERMLGESHYRDLWLRWRATQLQSMYRSMASSVIQSTSGRPNGASEDGSNPAKLYLMMDELTSEPRFGRSLVPRLSNAASLADAMLEIGLQWDNDAVDDGVVLLRPHRLEPLATIAGQGPLWSMNESTDLDQIVGSSRGSSFFHVAERKPLVQFASQVPFGPTVRDASMVSQPLPAGSVSRRHLVQCLAKRDTDIWVDGGQTMVRDQHDWLAPIVDVFRRLPKEPFETVEAATRLGAQLTVRRLSRDGVTYVYVVNSSPWAVSIRVQLEMVGGELKPLTPYHTPGRLTAGDDGMWWEFTMQPFDVVGGILTTDDVTFSRVTADVPENALAELRSEMAELSARVSSLVHPRQRAFHENPDFEASELLGWFATQDADVQIDVASDTAHAGRQSLRITSGAPVAWVRSKPFSITDSGRLLLRVWARHDGNDPPRLRLMGESETTEGTFIRQVELPMSVDAAKQWRPYDLWIDDIPVAVKDMRFGIDVLGAGQVWLDDAQAFDLNFSRGERNELSKFIALADLKLRQGRLGDCRESLDQYWSRFLMAYVSPDTGRVARVTDGANGAPLPPTSNRANLPSNQRPSNGPPPAADIEEGAEDSEVESMSALDRLRRLVPSWRR